MADKAETPEDMSQELEAELQDSQEAPPAPGPLDIEDPMYGFSAPSEPEQPDADESGSAPPVEDAPPQVDESLLARAEQIGISREEAGTLNRDSLERFLSIAETAAPPKEEQVEADLAKFDLSLTEDEADEAVIQQLGAMNEHYHAQVKALNDEMTQLRSADAKRAETVKDARIDGLFAGLEADVKKQVTDDVRKNINDTIDVLSAGRAAKGLPPAPLDALFQQALNANLDLASLERTRLTEQVEKRKRQMVSKPTHRMTKDIEQGRNKAIQTLAEGMKQMGMEPDFTVDTEADMSSLPA
jgi:hypothetical protein